MMAPTARDFLAVQVINTAHQTVLTQLKDRQIVTDQRHTYASVTLGKYIFAIFTDFSFVPYFLFHFRH